MGNLPNSRTITINTGDPIPPALLNEIQDCIVAGSKPSRVESYFPQAWMTSGGSPALLVTNPSGANESNAWKLAGSVGRYVWDIPFTAGDIIQALELDAYGDGVIDLPSGSGNLVQYAATINAAQTTLASINLSNIAASWATIQYTPFTPQLLAAGASLQLRVGPNTASQFVHIGRIRVTFSR